MPRKKTQSPHASSLGRDSTQKVPKDNDVELKWRESTLCELQSMFSGSIDPEVVQLVLSESNYNVNDAVEKLFVLSGIEQGQMESRTFPDSDKSTSSSSSSKKQKPNYHDDVLISHHLTYEVDSHFNGTSSDNSNSAAVGNIPSKSNSVLTSKEKMTHLSSISTTGTPHVEEVPRSLPYFTPTSSAFDSGGKKVSQEATLPDLCINSTSSVLSSGLPDFPDNIAQQFNTLQNQAKGPYIEMLCSQEPSIQKRDMYGTNGRPPVDQNVSGYCESVNLHDHDHELKGNLQSFVKQVISGSTSTEEWKKVSQSSAEKKPLDFDLSKKEKQTQSTSAANRSGHILQVPYRERQNTSNSDSPNSQKYNYMCSNSSRNTQKTSPIHGDNKSQLQQKTNSVHRRPNHSNVNNVSKETTMFRPPAIQRQFPPFVPPKGFSQTMARNVSQPRFGVVPTGPTAWQQGLVIQRPPGHIPHQYLQGTFSMHPQFSFGRAHTAVVRHGFGVSIPFVPSIHQKLLILMRGLPGSGKSYLAQKLKGNHGVVLSTDDYFYRNQRYEFDVSLLGEAHEWNQHRAKTALDAQRSPVIIDNTNTQAWEMKFYVSMALKYGYHIHFVEPDTTWKWNVKELARRNQHGVTNAAIIRMKERYEHKVSVEKIMNSEGEPDAKKTANELETERGTDDNRHNTSSRPPSSPQQTVSRDLATRKAKSCGISSGEETAPKHLGSGSVSSPKAIESENRLNRLSVEEERFYGQRNVSKKDVNRLEGLDVEAKNGRSEKNDCASEVHEIDIGEVGNEADVVTTSPEPQRFSNTQQCVTATLSSLGCEDNKSDEHCGTFTLHDNHVTVYENDKSSEETAPKQHSAIFCVQKLSALASLACTRTFYPSDPLNKILEDSQAGMQTVEVSKSSTSPLSDSSFAGDNFSDKNVCYVESAGEGQANGERFCETNKGDFSKEAPIKGTVTCGVEYIDGETSLPLTHTLDEDTTASDDNESQHREPFESKTVPTPPPLSEILASASRTKLKRCSRSNSDLTQPFTDTVNSLPDNSHQLRLEPNLTEAALEAEVCDDSPNPENKTFDAGILIDRQSLSNLPNLSDSLQPSSSVDSQNHMSTGVEFLKTCFPDVDSDLMNAMLTAKSGDVMKVVDELLISAKAPSTEVPTFHADSLLLASQQEIFHTASGEAQKSLSPTEEIVNAAGAIKVQSNVSGGNDEIPSKMSSQRNQRDPAPRLLAQTQSPSPNSVATFQLTLEPAVALHLIEMFGPFAGVDFQDNISQEDLILDVDRSLARQLYKKWEQSVQTRKGISATKGGHTQRVKREPTGDHLSQFSRDQVPDIQRSPPRLPTEPQAGNLREIMDEQLALELSRNLPDVTEQDVATKRKRQKLCEMFPGIDPVALEEVFQANRYELTPSVEAVKASCNLSGQDVPTTVVAPGFNGRLVNQNATRKETEEDWSWLELDVPTQLRSDESSFQTLEDPSYLDYRAEAFQHYKLRDECFKKAALAFSKKQGQLAQFYAQQGHLHTEKIKEANARAAALILDQKNETMDENTIDLHGLHVTEAIEALESIMSERIDPRGNLARKGCKFINVVTGRGNHSRGGKARIKPAILEYLKQHNYRFTEPHPGLIKVFL